MHGYFACTFMVPPLEAGSSLQEQLMSLTSELSLWELLLKLEFGLWLPKGFEEGLQRETVHRTLCLTGTTLPDDHEIKKRVGVAKRYNLKISKRNHSEVIQ